MKPFLKSKGITVRFSIDEHKELEKKAFSLGMLRTTYLRYAALNYNGDKKNDK